MKRNTEKTPGLRRGNLIQVTALLDGKDSAFIYKEASRRKIKPVALHRELVGLGVQAYKKAKK